MNGPTVDASALIAFLRREPGADIVEQHLRGSAMSAVNVSEVLAKSFERKLDFSKLLALFHSWQVEIVPFDLDQAILTAELKTKIKIKDIAFADRACLALAISRSVPVVTADRAWKSLSIGSDVILIRGEVH